MQTGVINSGVRGLEPACKPAGARADNEGVMNVLGCATLFALVSMLGGPGRGCASLALSQPDSASAVLSDYKTGWGKSDSDIVGMPV